jgi:predicted nucleic acid-binding protein
VLKLVLDASVAIKWINPHEPLADTAILIREDYERGSVSLVVPTFWEYEVANGVNKAVARGQLSTEEDVKLSLCYSPYTRKRYHCPRLKIATH